MDLISASDFLCFKLELMQSLKNVTNAVINDSSNWKIINELKLINEQINSSASNGRKLLSRF